MSLATGLKNVLVVSFSGKGSLDGVNKIPKFKKQTMNINNIFFVNSKNEIWKLSLWLRPVNIEAISVLTETHLQYILFPENGKHSMTLCTKKWIQDKPGGKGL